MNDRTHSSYETRRHALARVMSRCAAISRYDTPEEEEAWTLAHAFLDLEESFDRFTGELLPKLERNDQRKCTTCSMRSGRSFGTSSITLVTRSTFDISRRGVAPTANADST
jgi:hypothetical protein